MTHIDQHTRNTRFILTVLLTSLILISCSSVQQEEAKTALPIEEETSITDSIPVETKLPLLKKQIDIQASKEEVWQVLLDDATYRLWTTPFAAGSYFTGNWQVGDTMRFLTPQKDGALGIIVEHKPNEKVVIEYLGYVFKGEDDTKSPEALKAMGMQEIYRVEQNGETTTLFVTAELEQEYIDFMMPMWDEAFALVKELSEKPRS